MSDTSAAETSESLTIAVEDVDGNVSADQPNSFTSSNDTPETLSKNGNKRKGRTSGGGCGGGASRKRPRVEQLILKNSPFEGTESNAELRQERAEMFPERSGITFESKGKVEVKWSGKNGTENWFPARFIAFDGNSGQVQVHFNNWSSRYDEWIDSTSDRLRPPTEPSESETPEPDRKSQNYEVGEFVTARWSASSMRQPAKILSIDGENLMLVYGDGLKKSVKSSWVRKMSEAQLGKLDTFTFGGEFSQELAATDPLNKVQKTYSRKRKSTERPVSSLSSGSADKRISPCTPDVSLNCISSASQQNSTESSIENLATSGKRQRKPKKFPDEFTTEDTPKIKKSIVKTRHLDKIVDQVVAKVAEAEVCASNVRGGSEKIRESLESNGLLLSELKSPRSHQVSPRAPSIKRTCVTDKKAQAQAISKKWASRLSPPPLKSSPQVEAQQGKASTQQICDAAKSHIVESDPIELKPETLQHPILKELCKSGSWKKLPEKSSRPSSPDSRKGEDSKADQRLKGDSEESSSVQTTIDDDIHSQHEQRSSWRRRNIFNSYRREDKLPVNKNSQSCGQRGAKTHEGISSHTAHFLLSQRPHKPEPGTGAVFGQASLDFVMGKEQKKKATLAGSKTKLETSRDAGFKLSKEKTTEETQFRSGDRSKTLKSTSLGRNQKIHSVETLKSQWWYESVASWLGLEANTRIFCTSCRRRLSLSKDGSGNTESKMSTALSLEELKNLESDLFATEGFRFDIVPSHLLHSHVKNHRVDPTHINAVAFLESFDKGELTCPVYEKSTEITSPRPGDTSVSSVKETEEIDLGITPTIATVPDSETDTNEESETTDPSKRRWVRKIHKKDQKKLTDRGHRDQAAKNSDTLIGEKNDSGDLSSPEDFANSGEGEANSDGSADAKPKKQSQKRTLQEWLTGREDWLVVDKGLVKCRVCCFYASGTHISAPFVRGVAVSRLAMVREHELKLQHVKNLQKYYTEVLKTAPPLITHAADVPGGLTEFSQEELKCPEPGCTRTFRRQKNLEEHLKHSHKPVSTSIEATSKLLSKPKGTPLRKLSTVKASPIGEESTTVWLSDEEMEYQPVKCLCGIQSKYGVMLKCSECQTNQHGMCFGIANETQIPVNYICYTCKNPPGVRRKRRRQLGDFHLLDPARFPSNLVEIVTSTLGLAARHYHFHKNLTNNIRKTEDSDISKEHLDLQIKSLEEQEREIELLEKQWSQLTGEDVNEEIPQLRQRLSHLQNDVETVASLADRLQLNPPYHHEIM